MRRSYYMAGLMLALVLVAACGKNSPTAAPSPVELPQIAVNPSDPCLALPVIQEVAVSTTTETPKLLIEVVFQSGSVALDVQVDQKTDNGWNPLGRAYTTIPANTVGKFAIDVDFETTYRIRVKASGTDCAWSDYVERTTPPANVDFSNLPPVVLPAPTPTPVDVCPNIEGAQSTVPEGLIINEAGSCVEPPVVVEPPPPQDVCFNIPGVQETTPPGYFNVAGWCFQIPPPPPDACPNIGGYQSSVPSNRVKVGGVCGLYSATFRMEQGTSTARRNACENSAGHGSIVTADSVNTFNTQSHGSDNGNRYCRVTATSTNADPSGSASDLIDPPGFVFVAD